MHVVVTPAVHLGACALALTLACSCSRQAPPPPQPTPEVGVLGIEPRDTPVSFEYVAQIRSPQQVDIVARVNGFLDKQVYTEGAIAGPIFTGGLISGQVAQASAGQQAALANSRGVSQSAFAEVENALVGRETLARQIQAEQRGVKALPEYARLARLQYDGGYTDYLTVLSAQEQLVRAELTCAQDLGQTYGALVDTYKAMGGGWVDNAGAAASRAPQAAASPAPADAARAARAASHGDRAALGGSVALKVNSNGGTRWNRPAA
jgi:hypothetical protein